MHSKNKIYSGSQRTIYLFSHGFPEEQGEVFLQGETAQAIKDGYRIIYCPYNVHSSKENVLNKELIKNPKDKWQALRYIIKDLFKHPGIIFKQFRFNLALVSERIAAARFYAQQIEQNAVVYTYWFDELAIMARFIKIFRPDIRWVSRAHAFDVYGDDGGRSVLFYKRNKISLVDTLYVVSENGAEHIKKQYPEHFNKIKVSYLGTEPFGPSPEVAQPERFVFATCAYMVARKRLTMLMEMVDHLKIKEIVWHVIGDGPEKKILEELALERKDKLKCIFHGSCELDEISDIYKNNIDCFINVSSNEGLPMSIMEATSAGIPVIATDVGGTREIVNETTGFLVDKDISPKTLADVINQNLGKFKRTDFREGVKDYWKINFAAHINYSKFYKSISR